jgi:hypothetical protein
MYRVRLSRFKSITSKNSCQSHPIHSNTHVISITEQGCSWFIIIWRKRYFKPIDNVLSFPFLFLGRKNAQLLVRSCMAHGSGIYIYIWMHLVGHKKNVLADGPALTPDGLRSRLSAVAAQTVRAYIKSFRILDFLRDLIAKPVGLTQKPICNGSRLPLYIDEGLRPIEPPQSI